MPGACRATVLFSVGLVALVLAATPGAASQPVTGCDDIGSSGAYTVTTDLASSTTCINVTADDVVIDGGGHTVRYTGTARGGVLRGVVGGLIGGLDAENGFAVGPGVRNVTIRNVEIVDYTVGIQFDDVTDGSVTEAHLDGNGVTLIDSENASVTDSAIVRGSTGIVSRWSVGTRIHDNRLSHNGKAGVVIRDSPGGSTVRGNRIRSNGRTGVAIGSSTGAVVADNRIHANAREGIFIQKGAESIIIRNNSVRGSRDGIRVESAMGTRLANNVVEDHRRVGVLLRSAPSSALRNNTLNGGGVAGLLIDASDHVETRENTVSGGDYGVAVTASNDSDLRGTAVSDVGVSAIALEAAGSNRFTSTSTGDAGGDDFRTARGAVQELTNLSVDASLALDLRARNVALQREDAPAPLPPDRRHLGVFLNVTATGGSSFLDLTARYDGTALPPDVDPATIDWWRYDGSWQNLSELTVHDPSTDAVSANISSFSVVAPLAAAPGDDESRSPQTFIADGGSTSSPSTEKTGEPPDVGGEPTVVEEGADEPRSTDRQESTAETPERSASTTESGTVGAPGEHPSGDAPPVSPIVIAAAILGLAAAVPLIQRR